MADGLSVDWSPGGGTMFFHADGAAWTTAEFHKNADGTYLRLLYRHPVGQTGAIQGARNIGKNCFPDDWNRWAAANGGKAVTP
jgi:hypothetical protein